MQTAKRFTNFSDETFIGYWDKQPWKFEPGESVLLQSYLAEHFAKHLIDRELIKKGTPTDMQEERAKLQALCEGNVEIKAETPEKLEAEMLNTEEPVKEPEPVKEKPKSKPKTKKSKDEEEFEG